MRSMVPMTLADFDGAPFQFHTETVLDATPDAVFDELGDPSLWFPMMRRSVWHTGATSGVGAEREVDVAMFGQFRERMLVWDRGASCAFTMTATSSPLMARMAEDWRLSRSPGGTRLEWIVAATPTTIGRPIAPALKVILRGMFRLSTRGLAKRTRWSAGRAQNAHAS